jgi:hypothetical protein
MMLTFHVKYKNGATFTYMHEVKNKLMLRYLFNQFRRDENVVRVLTEVSNATING